MATVEIELRKYVKANGTQPLVLRITAGKKISRKNTGLYVKASEWDDKKKKVNAKHTEAARINKALERLTAEAEGLKADAISAKQAVAPDKVMSGVFKSNDFYELARAREKFFQEQDKYNSAKNYASMIARLQEYAPTLAVEQITPEFLEGFRTYLKTPKKPGAKVSSHNTIVAHLSKISAVLTNSKLKIDNPFKEVKRGSFKKAPTPPLHIEDIDEIRAYQPVGEWESIAKDTFLFSFYAAGMSSKDILLLEWGEVRHGRIEFGRRKVEETSGVELSIPLNDITREILSRYDRKTKTVFNLVTMYGNDKASCKERETIQASINKALKRISLNSGIGKPLKFKDARTVFATYANRASGRNVYGIQQAMGHSKISTTEIYLGADSTAVDELLQQVYAASSKHS